MKRSVTGKKAKPQDDQLIEPAVPPGVDRFDAEGSILLVDAPLDATAAAWSKLLGGAVTHKPDVLGKSLRPAAPSYLLCRLAGCPWTLVQDLRVAASDDAPSDAHAKKLSAALKCRVIAFMMSDTAGVWGYWLYTAGSLTEVFDHNSNVGSGADPAKRLGPDARGLKLTAANSNVYASATEKLPPAKVARGEDLMDELMKAQNAPGYFLAFDGDDTTVDLEFADLDEDAIERLDYVAATKPARKSGSGK